MLFAGGIRDMPKPKTPDGEKNVITRIETNKRYVTDVERKALSEIFQVSYEYLIDGKEETL